MILKTISKGVAYGKVYQIKSITSVKKYEDPQLAIEAYQAKKHQVIEFLNKTSSKADDNDILLFQVAVLNDTSFENDVKRRIKETKSIELGFQAALKTYTEQLMSLNDPYFSSRVSDFEDLTKRLFDQQINQSDQPKEPIILFVDELLPSYIFEYKDYIKGVIVKKGAEVSHAAILMKERGIPLVIVEDIEVNHSDYVLIDTFNHIVQVNPTKQAVEASLNAVTKNVDLSLSHKPFKLSINLSGTDLPDESIIKHTDGVSLYRSEFLYHMFNGFPAIEKQYEIYLNLLKAFYPKPVVIRTYDFSEDKSINDKALRGVAAYMFEYNRAFLDQLSALLLASEQLNNLHILIPMVYIEDDYLMVLKMANMLKEKLGLKKPLPKIGVMIETEKAFMNLEAFKKVDFFSIGTNDLGLNLFNFDRSTTTIDETYIKTLSKAIKDIVEFSKEHQMPLTVCGDIASIDDGFKKLLEIGVVSFGIAVPFIETAKKIVQDFE